MTQPTGRLVGRVAMISGGANGAGAASSRLFARESAKVAIIDRDIEAGHLLEQELTDQGYSAFFVCADVSKVDQAEHAVKATIEKFGQIDILFNPFARKYPANVLLREFAKALCAAAFLPTGISSG